MRTTLLFTVSLVTCCGAAAGIYFAQTPLFEATAQIRMPRDAATERDDATTAEPAIPPEVLSTAVARLKTNGVQILLRAPLTTETDELARHVRLEIDRHAGQDVLTLTYITPDRDSAVPILTAIAECYLDHLRDSSPAKAAVPQPLADEMGKIEYACERQQSLVQEHKQKLRDQPVDDVKRAALHEKIKSLNQSLAGIRRDRLEAEHRFQQAKKDLDGGMPLELLAARFPDGPAKSLMHEALSQVRMYRELKQHAATFLEFSAVYGKNHPRML